jgi:hypothetical protein
MSRATKKFILFALMVIIVVLIFLPVSRGLTSSGLKDVGLSGAAGYVRSA